MDPKSGFVLRRGYKVIDRLLPQHYPVKMHIMLLLENTSRGLNMCAERHLRPKNDHIMQHEIKENVFGNPIFPPFWSPTPFFAAVA